MSPLPAYLELASLLSTPSIFTSLLPSLSQDTLQALLPYLTLSTQLRLAKDAHYSHLFGSTPSQITATLSELIDYQRDYVCSDDCPQELKDRYLVDVLPRGKVEGFELLNQVPDGIKVVFEGEVQRDMIDEKERCQTVQDFRNELKEWSGGLLENLDWNNVVLGGGSVLSITTGSHKSPSSSESDLDLFLYGLKPDELVPKVRSIIESIQGKFAPTPKDEEPVRSRGFFSFLGFAKSTEWRKHPGEMLIIKGHNAITLLPPLGFHPRRPVQIILTSFPSIFDALGSFDLDCCCIGFNGSSVLAVPRAIRAIQLKANLLDVRLARKEDKTPSRPLEPEQQDAVERVSREDRTFNTSASRTIKYLSRGYAFALSPAATKHLETTEDGRKFDELLRGAMAKAEDVTERQKTTTDSLNGLMGITRRYVNLKQRIARGQEGGIDTDYGPTRNAFMITLTSEMLKEEENEVIAKKFEDWRVKLWISIARCLSRDEGILPGSDLDDGILGSEVVPNVASFDMDCILASHEDGLNGSTYKVLNNQLLLRIPRSVLPTLESADEEMLKVVDSCTRQPNSSSSTPDSWLKVNQANLEELQFTAKDQDSFDVALASVKTNPNLASLLNTSPNSYIPELYPRQRLTKTSRSDFRTPPQFLQPLFSITGRELGITSPSTPYVYRILTLASLFQFKGISPELDVVKDTSFQLFASLSRAAVNLPTSAFPYQINAVPSNSAQDPVQSAMEDVQENGSTSQIRGGEVAEEVMERLKSGQRIIAEKTERDIIEKEMGMQRRKRVGELDEARKGWLDKWVRGEVML